MEIKCDQLCIKRYFKNHLKSQTHTNNLRKRQQLNKSSHRFENESEYKKHFVNDKCI